MNYSCYCLVSETDKTYVGFSTHLDRRLRQHNGEIQGGAKATHGHKWKRLCSVVGFPSQQSALQFEWRWKNLSRKAKGLSAVERRCNALLQLLNLERSTRNADAFSTYEEPLMIMIEDESIRSYFQDKEMLYGIVIE